ncbi:hypothetical protein GGR54DRAFT_621191 [Hypoxylon sp. NC1633]|nr:hypothetical protein GGR54DRAFT_621191 [Hypoxylon sp. NC1633]
MLFNLDSVLVLGSLLALSRFTFPVSAQCVAQAGNSNNTLTINSQNITLPLNGTSSTFTTLPLNGTSSTFTTKTVAKATSTSTKASSSSTFSQTTKTQVSSSSATSPPTKTQATPKPTPTQFRTQDAKTPLELKPVICNNESDFPGHADISGSALGQLASDFCAKSTILSPRSSATGGTVTDDNGVNYFFSVQWVFGCVLEDGSEEQSVAAPLGDREHNTCLDLMKNDFFSCKFYIFVFRLLLLYRVTDSHILVGNNGGVGGKTQAGCLLYTFIGGK